MTNDLFSIFDPLEKYWIVDSWGFRQMIAAIHERGSLSEVITWSIDERYHVSPSLLDPSLKDACGWNGSLYWQKGLTFQVLNPFTTQVVVKDRCHVSLKKRTVKWNRPVLKTMKESSHSSLTSVWLRSGRWWRRHQHIPSTLQFRFSWAISQKFHPRFFSSTSRL